MATDRTQRRMGYPAAPPLGSRDASHPPTTASEVRAQGCRVVYDGRCPGAGEVPNGAVHPRHEPGHTAATPCPALLRTGVSARSAGSEASKYLSYRYGRVG